MSSAHKYVVTVYQTDEEGSPIAPLYVAQKNHRGDYRMVEDVEKARVFTTLSIANGIANRVRAAHADWDVASVPVKIVPLHPVGRT